MGAPPSMPGLRETLRELNRCHFKGRLREPRVVLSNRLRASAGLADYPAWTIRLSVPYHGRYGWHREARDTLLHEMIHLWLRQNRRPSGHTEEFKALALRLGCPRYAKRMPPRWVIRYGCRRCGMEARYRRRVTLACRACCDRWNGGRFTHRYLLMEIHEPSMRLTPPSQAGMVSAFPEALSCSSSSRSPRSIPLPSTSSGRRSG